MDARAFLCLLSVLMLARAAVFSTEFEKQLTSYIEASMKCRHIPGMTLSVVKGDEIWSHGYGKEVIPTNKGVDADSRFNIGSITKSFTATLVGMLLSEKGLNWTTKVTDILGSSYEFVDSYRTKELTVRDLLSHRTGLARLDFGGLGAGVDRSVSRSDYCRRMKYLPEEIPFRDGFIYNNYMFMMAGHVAEVLGQNTWENLVTSKIFLPLEMNDTKIMKKPSDILEPNTARPYVYIHDEDEFVNGTFDLYSLYPLEPAGAIMSTAADMAKWMSFHLNLGKTKTGTQLIDQKLVKDIHQVTTAMNVVKPKPVFPADDIDIGYGYGLISAEYKGYRKVWHDGGWGSYISLMWTFPDMNFGLFASVNGPGGVTDPDLHLITVFYYISDYLLDLKPWLNDSTACTYPEPWYKSPEFNKTRETPLSVGNVAELIGTYSSKIFADIVVFSNTSDLHMDSKRVRGMLRPTSDKDRFLFDVLTPIEYATNYNSTLNYGFNVTFERDSATRVVDAITLHQEVDVRYEKKSGAIIIG